MSPAISLSLTMLMASCLIEHPHDTTQAASNPSPNSVNECETAQDLVVSVPEEYRSWMFGTDAFRFARVHYEDQGARRSSAAWATDYPDADVNLIRHFDQFDALEVHPGGEVVRLGEDDLEGISVLYMGEPGRLLLSEDESTALREYLLGGGFLFVDDFWGEAERRHLVGVMKEVFPDRELAPLPLEHEVFHCMFDLEEKPQVVSIHRALMVAPEALAEQLAETPAEYYGLFDDQDRLMMIVCHNTDLADAWERCDVDERYREVYSRQRAFPMGINILFYAMTNRPPR